MRYRTKIFLAAFATAALTLAAMALLFSLTIYSRTHARIERDLVVRIWQLAGVSLLVGVAAATVISWGMSVALGRRITAVAETTRRMAAGDSLPGRVFDTDEIGQLARAHEETVHELGRRLREQMQDQARMEAILGGMVEGVLLVNAEGRVQSANDAAQRMLHLDGSAIGRHYLELTRHPEIAALLTASLQRDRSGGAELSLYREGARTVFARAAPVHAPGGGAVLVLHDVTELRRADRVRRDFVANVSHELRTPLTAIRGCVETLLDADVGGEHARFLEIMARHTARMERLVQDLLRLARLDAGQERLDLASSPLQDLFEEVLTELQPSSETRRQRFVTSIDPPGLTVTADPEKLHEIVRNLVENAVNYSPVGSTITLRGRREAEDVAIEVLDEGPGVPAADLARVFERFYRVDKARSRHSGGTGLGLSIVKHLVDLHGGHVSAENAPEAGARFTVVLPHRAAVSRRNGGDGAVSL